MHLLALPAAQFLTESLNGVVLDVRSPSEFQKGHLPGAISFPLFTDEERSVVGTIYKQVGRESAIDKGLELVGTKLAGFVKHARAYAEGKTLYVYCWRGGMRSGSMAWLLRTAGLKVYTLTGGYKAYRKKVLEDLSQPFLLRVLGGFTGSGKTDVLHILRAKGQQVVDLEQLACHKGSSFGSIGQQPQPDSEYFSNLLHLALSQLDLTRPIWVEDESRMIGTVNIPEEFFLQMVKSPLLVLHIPLEWRLQRLVGDYGQADKQLLRAAFERIKKKLGGQHLNSALAYLDSGDLAQAAEIGLRYYDKAYRFGLDVKKNDPIIWYEPSVNDTDVMANELQKLIETRI